MSRSLRRSASFSNSPHRASSAHPPPLSVSRPSLLPRRWPNPDSGSAARRSQLAFFDRDCSLVEDHLYLGSDLVARDRDALRRHAITHVLSCVGSPELFSPEIVYKTLWLSDTPGQDIGSVLYDVFDYFEEVREAAGGRVLVHCSRGVSRSAALVVAYLMWRHSIPFEPALKRVRAVRPVADPNLGFASQLLSFQSRISGFASPAATPSCNNRCRLYRMAPHSPYDPLHLVPKMVELSPSANDLDSRGAFLVQVPGVVVYVWIGKECHQMMVCSARAAAAQIVRYEKVAKPAVEVEEGTEPSGFWSLFSDRGDVGNRRIKLYDLDYDIFIRAIRGGVVPPFPTSTPVVSPTSLPAKEGGWLLLKQRLLNGGVKDLLSSCNEPLLEDSSHTHNFGAMGTLESDTEVEPFGSPQSTLSQDLSTLTSSDFSSLSPTSTSSDWCNSLSPGSEFYYEGELKLFEGKRSSSHSVSGVVSPTECGHGMASDPRCIPFLDEVDEHDTVNEWSFSPSSLAVKGESMMQNHHTVSNNASRVPMEEEDCFIKPTEPALYQWPSINKIKNPHPGVLDSKSVYLLLASESRLKKHDSKVLYLWLGRQSELIHSNSAKNNESNVYNQLQKIGHDFLNQIGFSVDIPVQVIKEEEEPLQFLNHLFTFHQGNTKEHS